MNPQRIIISRTDSIGDVILTLPLAGILKNQFPDLYVIFMGSSYTRDICKCCKNIDEFIDWTYISKLPEKEAVLYIKSLNADSFIHVFPRKEIAVLAKKAKIKNRIGTTNRFYHWFTCNKLLKFSRKKSELHESQLNTKLLKPFGIDKEFDLNEITANYGFTAQQKLSDEIYSVIDKQKFNLILHPKSKGSAREWGLENFGRLIELLPKEKYKIFISGTEAEAQLMKSEILDKYDEVVDITGKFNLEEFISFISIADGLIAASTGPLHIAAALGKLAIGIYPPIKPMHPGRWKPIGENATFIVSEKKCNMCRKSSDCLCMKNITAEEVLEKLEQTLKQ